MTFNQVVLGSSPSGLTKKINTLHLIYKVRASQSPPLGSTWEAHSQCVAERAGRQ
jgi:hypothetical protein